MTTVTASIVSTGERERLLPCLESLAAQQFDGTLSVVVVQNGVDDGSDVAARRVLADVHVITNSARHGFASNHNRALAARDSDFCLVLNPDVVLDPGCIAALLETMQRNPRAGVVAPLLLYPSGEPQPSARRFPRVGGTLLRRTPLRSMFAARIAHSPHYLPPPTEDRRVDWVLGACLLARGAAWRDIGGFDPGFAPLYVEDVDLGWRMWKAGWEVWQTPAARAFHEHQAATDKVFFDRRTIWHLRGMMRFVWKHPGILLSAARPHGAGVELHA